MTSIDLVGGSTATSGPSSGTPSGCRCGARLARRTNGAFRSPALAAGKVRASPIRSVEGRCDMVTATPSERRPIATVAAAARSLMRRARRTSGRLDREWRSRRVPISPQLLNIAWFRGLQLAEGVPRVFQELHLRQVRAQRVGCSSHCGNRGVACVLGCVSRLLAACRSASRSCRTDSNSSRYCSLQRPGLLGEHPEPFCLLPRRFRQRAVLFGTVTLLIRFFPKILSLLPPLLGLDASSTHSESCRQTYASLSIVGTGSGS